MATEPTPVMKCSFCGKSQREVRKLVAGETATICDECVHASAEIIADEVRKTLPATPEAAALFAVLDAAVVGQVHAKRALVAALLQHFHRVHQPASAVRVPHVLLVGPTGSGKSALARAFCANAGLPAYHADVSRLSESGYIGDDVENFLAALLELAPEPPGRAHVGVLFLEGLEKIAARRALGSARDISGEGVQRELMRVLDGLTAQVQDTSKRHPAAPTTPFPCSRLFVAGCVRLDANATTDREWRDALRGAGMVAEFVARFDVIVPLARLTEDELLAVLTRPRGAVDEAEKMLVALGGRLNVTDGAARLIAANAARDPDGAWALTRPLQRYLAEIMTAPTVRTIWTLGEAEVRAFTG